MLLISNCVKSTTQCNNYTLFLMCVFMRDICAFPPPRRGLSSKSNRDVTRNVWRGRSFPPGGIWQLFTPSPVECCAPPGFLIMASIVTNLLTGGLLQGISGLINTIRGKSPEDAAKLAELAQKYQEDVLAADQAQRQAQSDVNKVEAASNSLFVAGWRPFIGWVCGTGLAFQFIVAPIATWASTLFGRPVVFPELDLGTLLTLLLGMLGLGGMRTFEKVNGVNSGH